jgi:ribosomal-protein-serine acetyltransferase
VIENTQNTCGILPISEGLCLRLLEEEDALELHGLIEANREYLARWLPWAESQTLVDSEDFIARSRDQVVGNDGFQGALVRDGAIIGMAGFPAVDWAHRSASIGYWLAEGQQGRGMMTAVVRRLVTHALTSWSLDRVEIRVAAENRRSRAIPERLGFVQEGILREAELVGDRHLDLVVYVNPGRGAAAPIGPR